MVLYNHKRFRHPLHDEILAVMIYQEIKIPSGTHNIFAVGVVDCAAVFTVALKVVAEQDSPSPLPLISLHLLVELVLVHHFPSHGDRCTYLAFDILPQIQSRHCLGSLPGFSAVRFAYSFHLLGAGAFPFDFPWFSTSNGLHRIFLFLLWIHKLLGHTDPCNFATIRIKNTEVSSSEIALASKLASRADYSSHLER